MRIAEVISYMPLNDDVFLAPYSINSKTSPIYKPRQKLINTFLIIVSVRRSSAQRSFSEVAAPAASAETVSPQAARVTVGHPADMVSAGTPSGKRAPSCLQALASAPRPHGAASRLSRGAGSHPHQIGSESDPPPAHAGSGAGAHENVVASGPLSPAARAGAAARAGGGCLAALGDTGARWKGYPPRPSSPLGPWMAGGGRPTPRCGSTTRGVSGSRRKCLLARQTVRG